MIRRTDVVVVGGGVAGDAAARAAEAGGVQVTVVDAVTRLLRPGDALRGVVLGDDEVVEACAVILAGPGAPDVALAVGAEAAAGGLRTDERGRVLDAAELPIPGLYAVADASAGRDAGAHAAARAQARSSR
jgi:NADPH-dependent 2,4-dienoyl-CoA reductase/sulfur reductase-like enzyme